MNSIEGIIGGGMKVLVSSKEFEINTIEGIIEGKKVFVLEGTKVSVCVSLSLSLCVCVSLSLCVIL
jgi:hypothetical protein